MFRYAPRLPSSCNATTCMISPRQLGFGDSRGLDLPTAMQLRDRATRQAAVTAIPRF